MFDRNRSSRWNVSVAVAAGLLLLVIYVATALPSGSNLRELFATKEHSDAEVDATTPAVDLPTPTVDLPTSAVDLPTTAVDLPPPADVPALPVDLADLEMPEDSPDSLFVSFFHEAFQDEVMNRHPTFHTHKLRTYRPHNWAGPGQRTIATVLTSRQGSMHDPYFLAAEQLVYRMLWDPRTKSQYTFTVFVAPFIHDDKRDILQAAGADVRELPLIQWETNTITLARWRDLFIKLGIWAQEDFAEIVLLDLDAFPIENIDGIFDDLQEQTCDRSKVVDFEDIDAVCSYTFAAAKHENSEEVNAGVLVTRPNKTMYTRLLRHMLTEDFASGMMEQSFLNSFFRPDGPFPMQYLDRKWNGFLPHESELGHIKVFHDKLWSAEWLDQGGKGWAKGWWNETWADMLALYESDEFLALREADGDRLY